MTTTQELYDRLCAIANTAIEVFEFDDESIHNSRTSVYLKIGSTGVLDMTDLCKEFTHICLAGRTLGIFED